MYNMTLLGIMYCWKYLWTLVNEIEYTYKHFHTLSDVLTEKNLSLEWISESNDEPKAHWKCLDSSLLDIFSQN